MPARSLPALAAVSAALLLAACAPPAPSGPGRSDGTPVAVTARLTPTQGNATAGIVRIEQQADRRWLAARIGGLKPGGLHGFHVHERGDCTGADGMSAGGHFDPRGRPHGHPGRPDRHAGDLPNLQADAGGIAEIRFEIEGLGIGGEADVTGRAIVVHAAPDDYVSQPAGNAGARIACGVFKPG